jgi:alkylation response protein AidB-like acyl-CoA dehydrogenase
MALTLTDDETMLVDSARSLFAREAPTSAFRALRDGGGGLHYDPAVHATLAENGFVAPNVSEADGGLGMGAAAAGLIAEQAGHTLATAPLLSAAMAATLIARAGTDQQKTRLLPTLIGGEQVLACALDESARHDPERLDTRAERACDSWALTGEKRLVIDGVGAGLYLVSASADGVPALFLVAPDAGGLDVRALDPIDGRNLARLTLAAAPAERLSDGDASSAISAALDLGRALLAAELLGVADEAFDRTVAYLKERVQFGRPIGSFQALQHRAARLYARLDIARGVVLKALRAIDEDSPEASQLASLSKAYMTKLAREVLVEAVQMHGGIGVTDDIDIGLFLKRTRAAGELLGDEHFHTERLARERFGL